MEIEWSESSPVPKKKRRRLKFDAFAEALREHPGRWAKWPTSLTAHSADVTAWHINANRRPAFPSSEFEALADEDGALWVRAKASDSP